MDKTVDRYDIAKDVLFAPQQMIDVRAERLVDAQGHLRSQCRLAVDEIGQGRAPHAENSGGLGDGKIERLEDTVPDDLSDMRWILHGHRAPFNDNPRDRYR